ncbi:MAG TPA: fibronectin type III domain-containing protein [Candidatus Angelobacter sp.]|nr:fibronectin type III domain-containing protein [Candidatus Angelobacter sp.]
MRSLIAILVFCSALLGCGVPGAPLPPSLAVPRFVGDLKAARKGETVTLMWTTPTETTDGELIRKPGKLLVQRALTSGSGGELHFQTISELPLEPALKEGRGDQATTKDSLNDSLRSGGNDFAVYTVKAVGHKGKSFGLPNRVSVPLLPSLAPPKNVSVHLVPLGVMLQWEQVLPPTDSSQAQSQQVKVMRRLQGSNEAVLVKQMQAAQHQELVDSTIEWEKSYEYWLTPVTLWQAGTRKGEIEGDDSAIVEILAHDSFPPAAPSGLQAVFSAAPQNSFIDLTWTPNIENDLAGYNIYRHTANDAPVKINSELVKTPRFPDPGIQPGMKYIYSVTAVDLRNNESSKSEETSETVPKN